MPTQIMQRSLIKIFHFIFYAKPNKKLPAWKKYINLAKLLLLTFATRIQKFFVNIFWIWWRWEVRTVFISFVHFTASNILCFANLKDFFLLHSFAFFHSSTKISGNAFSNKRGSNSNFWMVCTVYSKKSVAKFKNSFSFWISMNLLSRRSAPLLDSGMYKPV